MALSYDISKVPFLTGNPQIEMQSGTVGAFQLPGLIESVFTSFYYNLGGSLSMSIQKVISNCSRNRLFRFD